MWCFHLQLSQCQEMGDGTSNTEEQQCPANGRPAGKYGQRGRVEETAECLQRGKHTVEKEGTCRTAFVPKFLLYPLFCGQLRLRSDHTCQHAQFCARMTGSGTHGCQNRVLRPVSTLANSAATDYQSMRSSKSKLKASVYWRTRGQFWKLNQVQLFCDQSERKPISLRLFNARTCDCTSWRDRTR